jgi:ParB-like chromosome segregation protein Spo0J
LKDKKKPIPEIRIECAYDKLVSIDQLRPNLKNPNTHSEEQIAKLALLIKNHGWRHPITVSNRSGFIVAGHCRLMAAKLLELKQVPVDYQDFASEAEEFAVIFTESPA